MENQANNAIDESLFNMSTLTLDESDDSTYVEELPVTVLFKFIRPFNGDRTELASFIQNTNSAFSLAKPRQKSPLLLYVVSQLSTNVSNELELTGVHSWSELKIKLKQFYGHAKHLAQTHEELEMIRQHANESITDFFKRVERAKNDCIQAEVMNNKSTLDLPGIRKAIQETALRRFIIHCNPVISQMLRAREIDSLNTAYGLALQEERIMQYTKSRTKDIAYCSYCKTNTHATQNCRKRNTVHHSLNQSQRRPADRYTSSGHSGNYTPNNNNYRQQRPHFSQQHSNQYNYGPPTKPPFQQTYRPNNESFPRNLGHPNNDRQSTSNFNPRVNHMLTDDLNEEVPMMNAPLADSAVQEAFQMVQKN